MCARVCVCVCPIVSFKTGNLVTGCRQTELYSSLQIAAKHLNICEHVDTYVVTHGVIYLEGNCCNNFNANCTCDVS